MKKKLIPVLWILGGLIIIALCLHLVSNWPGTHGILENIKRMHGG